MQQADYDREAAEWKVADKIAKAVLDADDESAFRVYRKFDPQQRSRTLPGAFLTVTLDDGHELEVRVQCMRKHDVPA